MNVKSGHCAVVEPLAISNGHHLTLMGLFLSRIGDDDAAARSFLFLDPLHHDAVVEGSNVHNAVNLRLNEPVKGVPDWSPKKAGPSADAARKQKGSHTEFA